MWAIESPLPETKKRPPSENAALATVGQASCCLPRARLRTRTALSWPQLAGIDASGGQVTDPTKRSRIWCQHPPEP